MKKLLSIVLVIAMVVCTVPVVFAADLQGSGTESDPYLIYTFDDLGLVDNGVSESAGKYYKLMADIDIGAAVSGTLYGPEGGEQRKSLNTANMIGTVVDGKNVGFQGVFDGNGHKIYNFAVDNWWSNTINVGIFNQLEGNAVVKNLGVEDVIMVVRQACSNSAGGALAGLVTGSATVENCYIKNVDSYVTLAEGDYQRLGGMIGLIDSANATVRNCYSAGGEIQNSHINHNGDLIGYVTDEATIENCYAQGWVGKRLNTLTGANIKNNYSTKAPVNETSGGDWWQDPGKYYGTVVTEDVLKSKDSVVALGDGYNIDSENINNGFPVLKWQGGTELSLIEGLSGMGTEASPVLISSVADWKIFIAAINFGANNGEVARNLTKGKYFAITQDLDFAGEVISHPDSNFSGTLDGRNHVIKNFVVDGSKSNGLFWCLWDQAVIKNLGMVDVTIAPITNSYNGAFAGRMRAASSLENCYVYGIKLSANCDAWNKGFGGLAGQVFYANTAPGATFKNCYVVSRYGETGYLSSANISASPNDGYFGAIVGNNSAANTINIINCYTDLDILASTSNPMSAQGTTTFNVVNSFYNNSIITRSGRTTVGTGKTTAELKALAGTLGSAFKASPSTYFNSGYPMLKWESEELPSQPEFNTTITTIDDLKAISAALNKSYNGLEGVTITLAADLDLGGMEWNNYVIGKESKAFKGIFDGNGHIVSNFKLIEDATASGRYGLFGAIGGNGVIKNLGVKDVSSVVAPSLATSALKYPGSYHSGIVAVALDNAKIQGCFAKNYTIKTKDDTATYGVQGSGAGSVIGTIKGAGVVVENCYQYGFIEYNDSVGAGHGLIGGVAEGAASRIENCYSDEAIATCYAADKGKFINCYAVKTTGWSMYGNLPGITKTATEIKGITTLLGSGFIADIYSTNNGYPMLSWELDLTPLEGDGTAANPYLIIDIDTLAQVSLHTATEGKYYKMGNNIDFAGGTLPSYIGSVENTFKGTFDGDGHIIKNYVIKAPVSGMENYLGIFAAIGGNAVVKNVGIENVTVTNGGEWGYNSRIGGLVAMMYDSATVENCYARGVTFTDSSNGSFAVVYGGGLVGNMYGDGTVVKDCYATGVKETSPIVGSLSGLVGSADKFNYIKNCYSDSTLTMVKVTRMDDVTNSFRAKDDDGSALMRVGELVSAEDLKTKASALGSAFIADSKLINGGFPVLAWEANIEPDKSTNANLASITVSAGELSPEFSADTLSYTVSVENDVTEISISALAQDEKATVSGEVSGVALEVGNNVFNIVVTAEIGNLTKTYTITVVRAAAEGGEGGGTGGGGENPEDPEEPTVENEIKSVADLKALAAAVAASTDGLAGKTYTLTTNLDLNGETWTDYIGTSSMYFKGTFDGNGHVISNYKVANTSGTTNALFGAIGGDAIIKNLGVEDVTLIATGTNNIAGLVSNMYDNSKVTSCFARDFVNNQYPASDTNFSIAGLVARLYTEGTVLENCYAVNVGTGNSSVTVNNNGELFGCAVGFTKITNCYANGYLGIVYSSQWSKVTNCYFSTSEASFYPGWFNPQISSKDGWVSATHGYVGYKVTDSKLKTMADTIGNYFVFDKVNVNDRFPVLAWERSFDVVTDKTISGNTLTSVTIEKWNRSAGKVIVATYNSDGMLLNTKFANVSESGVVNVNFDISGADKVVVYILKNDGEATPMSKATKL